MADLVQLAKSTAVAHGLQPEIVCAVVEQESAWDTWAIRFEPLFEARYVDPMHLGETETKARSISWGLMQLMGEVAREQGFTGKYLSGLCDPGLGLEYGCRKLKSCFNRAYAQGHEDDVSYDPVRQALLYWNGGSNLAYPDQVKARIPKYATNNPSH